MVSNFIFTRIKKILYEFSSYSIFNAAAWLAIGAISSRGVLLISGLLIVRAFGIEIFTLYSFLIATIGVASVIANFGLGLTASKLISDPYSHKIKLDVFIGTSRLIIFFFSLLIGIIIIFNIEYFAKSIQGTSKLVSMFFMLTLISINALVSFENSMLIGFKKFKLIGLINLVSGISLLSLIYFYSTDEKFDKILYSTIAINVISYLIILKFTNNLLSKEFKRTKIAFGTDILLAVKISLPLFLSGIVYAPTIWLASTIVANTPEGATALGYFYAADNIRGILIFISAMLAQAALPYLSEQSGEKDIFLLGKIVRKLLFFVVGSTVVAVTIVIFFTPEIVLAYGLDYTKASNIIYILLFASIFVSINNVLGQILLSKLKTWNAFLFNLLWSIILLFITYIISEHNYTVYALPFGVLVSYLVLYVLQHIFIARKFKISLF